MEKIIQTHNFKRNGLELRSPLTRTALDRPQSFDAPHALLDQEIIVRLNKQVIY